jgi:hypothetical protein
MKLVNLTPHPIIIIIGEKNVTLLPSGVVARVSEKEREISQINNIPVIKIEYGDVTGLPNPEPDTIYIVSAMVAQAINRTDLFYPARLVRDENGKIIGCGALATARNGGDQNG